MAPMAGGGNRGGDSRLDHRHHHTSGASRSDDDDDDGGDSKTESQIGNGISNSNGNGGGRSDTRPRSPVAETLFRKDLISAMKLPDNEPLTADDYWVVADTWKQEWERGVQVPFKPEALPEPHVSRLANPPHSTDRFTFPKKLLCMSRRGTYTSDTHQVTTAALRSEQMCNYDLDELDQRWLNAANGERAHMGVTSISDLEMERTMEELEKQSWEKVNISLKHNEEEEQDDSVICDVCRSPDSEECNEMVFCDNCNICVHQACYGITTIPTGEWLCRTCSLNIKPKCELCPNKGGAMKSTKSGQKWAHVSCALWIPEVSIGCVEKMEPITKISSIPQSRWNLLCVLCKDRVGSCIQCSVKTCKVAYHVTCAFKRGLEMRAIIEDENADDGVKLRSYCQMHSNNQKRRESEDSDDDTKGKKKSKTAEERSLERRQKLLKIECEFYKGIDLSQVSNKLGIEQDIIDFIFRYWILKRKSLGNRPLLIPRSDGTGETGVISGTAEQEQDTEREKLKKFVSLRQDLERVRNLCYMVSRREKLQKSFVKLREQIFEKQLDLVADDTNAQQMSLLEISALLEANHGPTVYDTLFSHHEAERHTENDFEVIVSRISGEITENSAQIRKDNPYRKLPMPSTLDSKKSWAYKRIFSDTSASEEDVLNMSASMPKAGGRKKRSEGSSGATTSTITAEVAAANAAAMVGKKNNLGKKGNQRGNKQNNASINNKKKKPLPASKPIPHSDSSDSMSSAEENDKRRQSLKDKRKLGSSSALSSAPAKKVPSKRIFSDTDSDAAVDSPSFRPKSPVFRTKAAMKDFGVENLPKGGSKKPSKADRNKLTSPSPSRDSDKKSRNKPHYRTSSKGNEPLVNSKFTMSDGEDSIPSSSDVDLSESDSDRKIRRKKNKELADLGHIMIVPERAAARKATAKLKVGQVDKVQDQYNAGSGDASSVTSERRSKSKKSKESKEKELFTATDDSQASEDISLKSDPFAFVPQRKAAKKASAQIGKGKEDNLGYPTSQSPPKKSPINAIKGRKDKPSSILLPLSQRIAVHSDSDSDLEEPFPFRSPREKASRGRGTGGLNKSPRKRATQGSGRGRTPSNQTPIPQPVKKPLSSRAEALLSARASQLDVILGRATNSVPDKSNSSTSSVFQSPDKKHKTSEGRLGSEDDGNLKQSTTGEKSSSSSDVTRQRKLEREKRREQRKAQREKRRRSSQSSGTSSPSSSSSSSTVSSDNESHKRTNDNADTKQGDHKDRVSISGRGDIHSSPSGAGAPLSTNSSPAHCSPRSMPPTPEQISEPIGGSDKKKEDRFESRLFESFKENQAPPPTPGRHLTHLIGGNVFDEEEEENLEAGEERSSRQGKLGVSPSITSPLVSPQRSSQKGQSIDMKSPNSRLFDKSPNRPLVQSQVANDSNNSTKDGNLLRSPKPNESNLLSSKSPLKSPLLSNVSGGTSERSLNDLRQTNSIVDTLANDNASSKGAKDSGISSSGSFESDIKKTSEAVISSATKVDNQIEGKTGSNVVVKQSKQSDEGYGTDAKVSPTEQANMNTLLPPKESPSLQTVPEPTQNQCQEHLNSNSQYDLSQLMRNQQQRQQQQLEHNRIQQQKRQQELENQKLQQQQQQQQQEQKQQYPQQRELGMEQQNQWQQQLGQHMQGQNSQDLDSMQHNEALLNFIYKASMQQYPHGNNSQNPFGSMTPQQLQQMRDYGSNYNMELFAYYQQYFQQNQQSSTYNNMFQQQMGQFPGSTTGSGYNKKDLQAFEQLMMQWGNSGHHPSQWQSMNQMSQQRNVKEHSHHKYSEDQEQMFQLLQRQQQQRQHPNHQNTMDNTSSANTISSSSSQNLSQYQAGFKSTLPSTSAEDLQQRSSSTLGKVQNTSPLVSASGTVTASNSMMSSSQKPRGSRDSPRQHPTQSPRGGGGSHIQQGGTNSNLTSPSGAMGSLSSQSHHDIPTESAQSAVPSATPAEKLPGYMGNKKGPTAVNNSSSVPGKMPQQDSDAGLNIPQELLDSIAAVAQEPVWKPNSERSAGDMSPTKNYKGMTPESQMRSPGKTPNSIHSGSVHGQSSTRRTSNTGLSTNFEELVKKVESSPTKSPRNDKSLELAKLSGTTPRSERSILGSQHEQSDLDRSDYDDTKGGVDYDDFDEDDWTKTTPESSSKTKRGRPKGAAGGRGRGRGSKSKVTATEPFLYTTNAAKSNTSIIERLAKANKTKQKRKPVNIDNKALEQVHKTVAGTDYDFEDEFGDDAFGEEKVINESNQFSLQALREKSKKARESDEESVDEDQNDFDDLTSAVVPTRGRGARGRPRGRGKRGSAVAAGVGSQRGRGRGRGRGRPSSKTFQTTRHPSSKSPSDPRDSGESSGPEESDNSRAPSVGDPTPFSLDTLDQPKLPKLKLGALIVKKESKSSKSSKHHRKSSVDSKEGEPVKVPKLKIRLGPKPESVKELSPEVSKVDKSSDKSEECGSEVDGGPRIDNKDKSSDSIAKITTADKHDSNTNLDNNKDKTAITTNEDDQVSNPVSISSKANDKSSTVVVNAKQSPKVNASTTKTGVKSSSAELDAIFGPSHKSNELSSVIETNKASPSSAANSRLASLAPSKEPEQEKSELDLLREELMKDTKIDSRTPPQASPHADTAYGPLRKAINAARNSSSASTLSASVTTSSNTTKNDLVSQNQTSSEYNVNASSISTNMSMNQSDSIVNSNVGQAVDDGNTAANSDSSMMKMKFKDLKMKFKSAEYKPDPRKSPLSSSVHHQAPNALGNSDPSQRGGNSSMSSNTASGGNSSFASSSTSTTGGQPKSSGGGGGYARMRKKELLNQYYGQDLYPAPVNGPSSVPVPPSMGSQSHTSMSGLSSSMLPTSSSTSHQYQRPVSFKMPKAVASVISVPTRADYQTQLEANLERKRKRDKGLADANGGNGKGDGPGKGGDGKGGRKKKGRGKQTDEDPEYKASHLKVSRGDAAENSKGGNGGEGGPAVKKPKTRGKPPKKCLAESPPHEEDRVGDMKTDAMKFAAAIRAEFENPSSNSNSGSQASKSTTSSLRDVRMPKDKNKRKRATEDSPVVSKTPKIVIKFSKDSSKSSPSAAGKGGSNLNNSTADIAPATEPKQDDSNKNGIDASPFDFVENECAEAFRQTTQALPMVDGTMDGSAYSSMNNSPAAPATPVSNADTNSSHSKLPKIKIKVPTA